MISKANADSSENDGNNIQTNKYILNKRDNTFSPLVADRDNQK